MLTKPLYQGPIFVQKSPIHGYGVFAAAAIKEGELIEECYALVVSERHLSLDNYYFRAGEDSAIPLGFGCIYNHSQTPNISYNYEAERQLILFKTLRAIAAGEELCSSYGTDWFASRELSVRATPLWHRLKQQLGILLRATIVCAGLGALLYGVQYFGLA